MEKIIQWQFFGRNICPVLWKAKTCCQLPKKIIMSIISSKIVGPYLIENTMRKIHLSDDHWWIITHIYEMSRLTFSSIFFNFKYNLRFLLRGERLRSTKAKMASLQTFTHIFVIPITGICDVLLPKNFHWKTFPMVKEITNFVSLR